MQFSVIVPTYDRSEQLCSLLYSLTQCDGDLLKEVIVCDDGSTADVQACLGRCAYEFPIRYLAQPHRGFRASAARNLGIRVAAGDKLLFLDDDVIAPSHLLTAHANAHAVLKGPGLIIGLRHRKTPSHPEPAAPGNINDHRAELAEQEAAFIHHRTPWYFAYTCNLSVDTSFRGVPFDEAFTGWGNEDLDYAYRVWRCGAAVRFARDAWVTHTTDDGHCRDPFRSRDLALPADFRSFLRNARYLASKYPEDQDLQEVMSAAIAHAEIGTPVELTLKA